VIPTRRALGLLAAWLALAVAAAFAPALVPAWGAAGLVLAAAFAIDGARAWRRPPPEARRQLATALAMGTWSRVRLALANPTRAPLAVRVHDHHPTHTRAEGMPRTLTIPPGGEAEIAYRLWPDARGAHDFGPIELRVASPWRLFERRLAVDAPARVRAYPNFRAVVGYELLAAASRTGALGIRHRPRRGQGLDFHQLRDYRAGDALRQIDWKATARLRRAISRDYQDERDQQIVFLLDCGRRLHAKDGERSHFDAVLDAVLLAAHVAIRQGDAVGLLTFSGAPRWLAPRKGAGQLHALLNALHDLETGPRAADFLEAARSLVTRVRKRALVVLLSNVRDEDATELATSLRVLGQRHFVLLASLRETALRDALRAPIRSLDDALRASAVHLYLEQRRRALRGLARNGALLLDSEPQELPVRLVNGYLDVKAAGVL
jgi:uncharacterized protein (DUF58 family)